MSSELRVLIVEDDVLIAAALKCAFDDVGFKVVESATTTADAMAFLGAHSPDVLVLDVSLADRADGWGLAEVANQICTPPPVIIFSTGNPEAIPQWALETGSVVAKPADPQKVADMAVAAINGRGIKGALSGLIDKLKL